MPQISIFQPWVDAGSDYLKSERLSDVMCGLGASGNPAAADRARQGVHVPVHPAEEGGGHHPFDQRGHEQFSFSQVRVVDGQTSIAPVLMRYQRGCQQVRVIRVIR